MIKKKILACQIFTDELLAVLPKEYEDIDIAWLDAGLHANLDKLEIALKQAVNDAAAAGEDIRVLFGNGCHPDICQIVNNQGEKVLGAKNCIQAFCQDNIEVLEQNRTVVITPGWILPDFCHSNQIHLVEQCAQPVAISTNGKQEP